MTCCFFTSDKSGDLKLFFFEKITKAEFNQCGFQEYRDIKKFSNSAAELMICAHLYAKTPKGSGNW